MSKTQSAAARRPPTNAKLKQLLEALASSRDDMDTWLATRDAIQKLYRRGLPSGLDPAVVAAAVAEVMPAGIEIKRQTKRVGAEYDGAIVAGVREHLARYGVQWMLEIALLAALTEHGSVPLAAAYDLLWKAQDLVGRDPSTNAPADRSGPVLERVSAAMDAWFAPNVVAHTLELARQGMHPTAGSSGERHWVNPPQMDVEWSLLIGCALHPSEACAALLEARCELVPRLDEPARAAVYDIFTYARAVHGSRVPVPPD